MDPPRKALQGTGLEQQGGVDSGFMVIIGFLCRLSLYFHHGRSLDRGDSDGDGMHTRLVDERSHGGGGGTDGGVSGLYHGTVLPSRDGHEWWPGMNGLRRLKALPYSLCPFPYVL